jgi:hypothetical protein
MKVLMLILVAFATYPLYVGFLTVTGPDREIQQGLVDITEAFSLTQIHNQPTREENLLDLVFVTSPTLVKSSTNVLGISDNTVRMSHLMSGHLRSPVSIMFTGFDGIFGWV